MGNKTYPPEVITAMKLATEAGWPVSDRSRKVLITTPDGVNITIGHNPNDESMKVFRSTCRSYNLIGQGPARTPKQVEAIVSEQEKKALAEADRLNAQRRAFEKEERAKQEAIRAVRQKSRSAIQQGMVKAKEKSVLAVIALPSFDKKLLLSRESADFLLDDGTYYCINCLEGGERATFKAPQGLAAHRGSRHGFYQTGVTQDRVQLPADVETALDMLRAAIGETVSAEADPKMLEAKEAELETLRQQVERVTQRALRDQKEHARIIQENQETAEKALVTAVEAAENKAQAAREAEVSTLMQNFLAILMEIRKATEDLSPIQAVAKIDEILRENLKK